MAEAAIGQRRTRPDEPRLAVTYANPISGAMKHVLIWIARLWQLGPSRVLPPTCRFAPSCSEYAIGALTKHGAIKGGWLAAKRLMRCHPWGGQGYDPVP